MLAPELDERIPAAGKYALQKQTGAARKVRVLTA
jgi:hypothetical protein